MEKTALLFVSENTIKIVVGNTLKIVKFTDMDLDHNKRFFERLFAEAKVVTVEQVSEMTKDALDSFVAQFAALTDKPKEPLPKSALVSMPSSHPPVPKQAPEPGDGPLIYRSTAATHIIVDDLPIGSTLRGTDTPVMLSIPPDRPINLSTLNPETIRKSAILRRLINQGVLVPCTPTEANQMEAQYDSKIKQEADARFEAVSPMIDDDTPGSAKAFWERNRQGHGAWKDDAPETINVTANEPASRTASADLNSPLTMTQLMQMTGADDGTAPPLPPPSNDVPTAAMPEPLPKRQLAARPPVEKTGIAAKPTRRV
jgi:hypothetical protein